MSTKDYSAIAAGLKKFVRLIPLRQDPTQEKYIQDEFDLAEALSVVKTKFLETAEMFGKRKYKDSKQFDFIEDVREEMEEWLLNDENVTAAAVKRKKFQPMYYLVLLPVIELFTNDTHAQALRQISAVIADVENMILNHDINGHFDDAKVIQAMISKEMKVKEDARMAKRTKRKSKHDRLIEEVLELSFA